MGSTFSGEAGATNRMLLKGGLSAGAGGLDAAAGQPPPAPVDFSGIVKKFKKQPVSMSDRPDVIPKPITGDQGGPMPDFSVSPAQPMPDLYSGQNAQLPQLRKSIPLPFYGY